MYADNCTDCGDGQAYNPKVDGLAYANETGSLIRIQDPVEEEIHDVDDVLLAYSVLPIIPFLDNSDATLRVLRKLYTLSPTDGSCINNKCTYTTGGGIRITEKVRPGASYGDANELSLAQTNAAFDQMEALHPDIDLVYWLNQMECMAKNWEVFGNVALRVKWYSVAGKRYVWFEAVDCEYWRYWATRKGEPKMAVISEQWDFNYITKYPPDFVGVWPNVTVDADGANETLIHVKNHIPGRPWYGLPKSQQALYYKYWEYQLGQYGTRGYANQWSARVFLETSGDNVEPGSVNSFRRDIQRVFTFQGDGRRILHRHKSDAHEATKVHEFKDETSHEFHDVTAQIAENNIIKAHDWHRVLMGIPTPGRLGGESEFDKIYKVKYVTTISPTQDTILRPFNTMLAIASEYMGFGVDYSIGLANRFADIMQVANTDTVQQQQNNGIDGE